MTDTEIIIEVAKLDGFKWYKSIRTKIECLGLHLSGDWHEIPEPTLLGKPGNYCSISCPPYLTSRDAIIPVIEKQHPGVLLAISKRIKDETHRSTPTLAGILAPPRRLCIALLKETGKWRDQ